MLIFQLGGKCHRCPQCGTSEVGVQVPVGAGSADCQARELGCGLCCCQSSKGKVALACPENRKRVDVNPVKKKLAKVPNSHRDRTIIIFSAVWILSNLNKL